jgi:hypothetical protein
MLRFQPAEQYKFGIIMLGMACLLFALAAIPAGTLTLGLLGVLLFATFVAPRMTLTLPRSARFSLPS